MMATAEASRESLPLSPSADNPPEGADRAAQARARDEVMTPDAAQGSPAEPGKGSACVIAPYLFALVHWGYAE